MQFTHRDTGLHIEMADPIHAASRSRRSLGGWPLICGEMDSGQYRTLETGPLPNLTAAEKTELSAAAAALFGEYLQDAGRILVCGLGNSALTADCLGPAVCSRLTLSGPLPGGRELYSFIPGVSAVTGISTAKLVRAAAECVSADAIVLVDALCARSAARLSSVIQFSDCGLVPGSGTAEKTDGTQTPEEISLRTMPCPVVTAGIPTIIRTVLPEGGDTRYLVTDSAVDRVVEEGARILATALLRSVLVPR